VGPAPAAAIRQVGAPHQLAELADKFVGVFRGQEVPPAVPR